MNSDLVSQGLGARLEGGLAGWRRATPPSVGGGRPAAAAAGAATGGWRAQPPASPGSWRVAQGSRERGHGGRAGM